MSFNLGNFKAETEKVSEWLSKEYSGIHTGQATPSVLDSLSVESYGARQPIKNVASINIEDAKTLRVAPWDKSQIKAIENAIISSDLGLSVATDDSGLRVIFPHLTTENREKLVKVLKQKLEDGRISIRKLREEAIHNLKESGVSEDEMKRAKEDLQKLVDEANKKLEEVFEKKKINVLG